MVVRRKDNNNIPGRTRPGNHRPPHPRHRNQWSGRSRRWHGRWLGLLTALHRSSCHRRWRAHLAQTVAHGCRGGGRGRTGGLRPSPTAVLERSRRGGLRSIPHPLGLDVRTGLSVGGGQVLRVGGWGNASPRFSSRQTRPLLLRLPLKAAFFCARPRSTLPPPAFAFSPP
jgi:hypothetical protein